MKQEESCANHMSYNGLISKIYKELNSVAKTIDNLILKVMFFFFSKENIQIVNRHVKRSVTSLIISSVQFSHSVMPDSLPPHEPQHARPPCASPTPRVHPNPCPLSQWCHPTISSSVIPFSSGPQSFPASGSLQMSQLFTSGGQSIGVSASISVLPMNTQDWSPLGWTGWP